MMKKSRYKIVPATVPHAIELAKHMREPDKEEIWAAAHETPENAILCSLGVSRDAKTGFANDRLICMFGVGSEMICSTTGIPWLLATDELERCARPFLRRGRKVVGEMMNGYQLLRNYVDARNTAAIRWLGWVGFEILPSEPFGVDRLPFHPFEMRA
jgi:hypothetical protein